MRLIPSLIAIAAAASAVTGARPALAQTYGVAVTSNALAAHAGPAACDVNWHYGPGVSCSTPDDPGHVSAAASVGPTASASTATTASATVYEDGHSFLYYGDPGGYGTATATARADLSSASLHLSASASDSNIGAGAGAGGSAMLQDTLHFSVAGAGADTHTTIGVTLSIDGTMATSNALGLGEFYGGFNFGGSTAQFYFGNSGGSATNPNQTVGSFSTYPGGFDNGVWTSNADYTVSVFTGTFTLTGTTEDLSTFLNANLNCSGGYGGGSSCDYGNTAKISLQLPSDVSFTSDSGVFLNGEAITAAVPEPQTWALMLGGLGSIGAALRRRRCAHGGASMVV